MKRQSVDDDRHQRADSRSVNRGNEKRRSVDAEKGERYVPPPRATGSVNAKLQNVAGVVVVLVVESPAVVAKSGYCRPPGHCRQTMLRYVLTRWTTCHYDCAGHCCPRSFHNPARHLAY